MKEEFAEHDTQLRRYLLGELTSDERQKVEDRLFLDDDYLEQMLIVEEELIDDYDSGNLPSRQREKYQKLFLATREGQRKLLMSRVLKKQLAAIKPEVEPQPLLLDRFQAALARLFSPPVLKVAAAMLVVGLGALSWWTFFQSDLRTGITALKRAYREQRPLEARITGFPYADYRGASGLPNQALAARSKADKAFQDLLDDNRTPASLHGLGKYYLTSRNFDEAIRYLEEGLKAESGNTAIHVDLAVALLERGKLVQANAQPEKAQADFDNSRKHLQEALTLNPASLEARFNLALLFQTIKSWKDAEENWRSYLAADSSTEWAEEAKRYLNAALEAQKN